MTDPVQPQAAASAIDTVAATPDPVVNPRTGEPRRPWAVWVAAILLFTGVAVVVAGVLWTWWLSVETWLEASWLHAWASDAAGELTLGQLAWLRAGLAIGEFVVAVLVGAAALIAGYYGWRGYRWTRWAGVLAVVVSCAALLLHPVAWAGVPLVLLGAIALWLPPAGRFFAQWHGVRHPAPAYPELAEHVVYGPLPRYREA